MYHVKIETVNGAWWIEEYETREQAERRVETVDSEQFAVIEEPTIDLRKAGLRGIDLSNAIPRNCETDLRGARLS